MTSRGHASFDDFLSRLEILSVIDWEYHFDKIYMKLHQSDNLELYNQDYGELEYSDKNHFYKERYPAPKIGNTPTVSIPEYTNTTTSNSEGQKRKIVLIATFMRSGSTFLGEFFNVHRDCFYQFEPLHAFSNDGGNLTRFEFLKSRFDCKFEDLYDRSKSFKVHNSNDKQGNFVFRRKSRRLCRPPFCSKDHSNNIKDCSTYCDDVNPVLASKTCSKLTPAQGSKKYFFAENIYSLIRGFEKRNQRIHIDLKIRQRIQRING